MTRIAVVVLVDVPGEVIDPRHVAAQAVRQALVQGDVTSDGSLRGTNVRLMDDSHVFCSFRAWDEINVLIKTGALSVSVSTPTRDVV